MGDLGPLTYFVIDAFAERPFTGNPAAVVPLANWPDDNWLQNVAMEMNLSETAFFVPEGDGYRLRWFTPKVEVDLCGHATLATAKAMVELGLARIGETIKFSCRSGELTARVEPIRIVLDFPVKRETPAGAPAGLIEALGVKQLYVGKNQFDYLVEVASEVEVRGAAPDFKRLGAVSCRGTILTARSDDPTFDFASRFFAPAGGIDEDPVTGSAHCCLADFWSKRLGKTKFVAFQASARGGVIDVELMNERVLLGGSAVTVARGELLVETVGG
jgi:PhzF family phenazine biosynthesis protein